MRTGVRMIALVLFLSACGTPRDWAEQYEGSYETQVATWRFPCGTPLSETDRVPPAEETPATLEIRADDDGAHFALGPCSVVAQPGQTGYGDCGPAGQVWGAGIADLSVGARVWAAWDTPGVCETSYARATITTAPAATP